MCTTYLAATLAERLPSVERTLLIRLNPAVEHKTRGNAALAIHTAAPVDAVRPFVKETLNRAESDDPRTNPGAVIAPGAPDEIPAAVGAFADAALHEIHDIEDAAARVERFDFETVTRGNGRGIIGAIAAVGAWRSHDDWTYECIAYRQAEAWGSEREVDAASVFDAAAAGYPAVWDTVDRGEGYAVCVPRTPCPILHGIRGEDPESVERVSMAIESEPVASRHTFVTNQGTDAHLQEATLESLDSDDPPSGAFRVTGTVQRAPETREGGHVFFDVGSDAVRLPCAAFEPTKRFRDHVRKLRTGDRITACGELSDGTLKLEKFAVRELVTTERVTPTCPSCERTMESAGRDQGYRCRDCGTKRDGKASAPVERDLQVGWYEVPPVARRHVAKPLVRGGFDAPVHPER